VERPQDARSAAGKSPAKLAVSGEAVTPNGVASVAQARVTLCRGGAPASCEDMKAQCDDDLAGDFPLLKTFSAANA
jgi:hypothetical protein